MYTYDGRRNIQIPLADLRLPKTPRALALALDGLCETTDSVLWDFKFDVVVPYPPSCVLRGWLRSILFGTEGVLVCTYVCM